MPSQVSGAVEDEIERQPVGQAEAGTGRAPGDDNGRKLFRPVAPQEIEVAPREPTFLATTYVPRGIPRIDLPKEWFGRDAIIQIYHDEARYRARINPNYVREVQRANDDFLRLAFDNLITCANIIRIRESALYLAADMMHRVLSKVPVNRLLCYLITTVLLIVQKYEPTDDGIIGITYLIRLFFGEQTVVTRDQILRCEEEVLRILDYNLETVTPYLLLRYFSVAGELSLTENYLCNYLTQLAMICPSSALYSTPLLTAAAVSLSIQTLRGYTWTPTLYYYTAFSEADLMPARRHLIGLWRSHHEAARLGNSSTAHDKFASPGYGGVSQFAPPAN